MTFKEFTGKNVEEAIRAAMREFSADLADLDIEILSQGSRGILGVGGDEARILAAPKSAVAEATSLLSEETPARAGDEADAGAGARAPETRSDEPPAPDAGFPILDAGGDEMADAMPHPAVSRAPPANATSVEPPRAATARVARSHDPSSRPSPWKSSRSPSA
jgi:spoIIIJ-associated protein